MLSCVLLLATLWTVAHQTPLSMGFPRQKHWNGLPFSSPGTLPDPEVEPVSVVSSASAGRFLTTSSTGKARESRKIDF